MYNDDNQNEQNEPQKSKFILIAFFIIYFFVSVFLIQQYTTDAINQNESVQPTPTEATVQTEPVEYPDMVDKMEYLGSNKNALFVGNITFYYYRDVVTDCMYLVSSDSRGSTVTQILNPETGLPMTYAQYKAMDKLN